VHGDAALVRVPVRRLTNTFRLAGRGTHTGAPCAATVRPAETLVFVTARGVVPATLDAVVGTRMGTTLQAGGTTVRTPEHLLAALAGAGVFGAEIAVEGPELPLLDGSAQPWLERMQTEPAGELDAATGPAEVRDGHRLARLEPGPWRVVVELTDRGGLAALGPTRIELDPSAFATLAAARTFAWAPDVPRLLAAGYGQGSDRTNTVVIGEPGTTVRMPGEPLLHKSLDAIGDLALLGRPWRGTLTLVDSGHDLHVALARHLAA
jgi:UDP-3-O-[3-hydroxymyristoyl] N-acetylglucosamine deacetylase